MGVPYFPASAASLAAAGLDVVGAVAFTGAAAGAAAVLWSSRALSTGEPLGFEADVEPIEALTAPWLFDLPVDAVSGFASASLFALADAGPLDFVVPVELC
jgi:hypothetical protein